jgi:hypothetical protein
LKLWQGKPKALELTAGSIRVPGAGICDNVLWLWVANAFFLSLLEVERRAVAFFLSSPEIQACARLNAPGPEKTSLVFVTFFFLRELCDMFEVARSSSEEAAQAC